jgi:hypothetical protein
LIAGAFLVAIVPSWHHERTEDSMNALSRVALLLSALPLLVTVAFALPGQNAVITLGTDPEPPVCVDNPGGTVTIFWDIQHLTTPDYVVYRLLDPTHSITLEEQIYPGDTGIAVTRQWTVPTGLDDGTYWVRIEYYSVEVGNEANAEVCFLVCCEATPSHDDSWSYLKTLFM